MVEGEISRLCNTEETDQRKQKGTNSMNTQTVKRSTELIAAEKEFFAPCARIPYYPLMLDHAHGSTLTDVDGKSYLDLLTSASALNVGHTPEPIVEAIIAQVRKMIHYTPAYMYHEPLVHLAKKMCEITPGDFPKKVIFGLTGSDSNDALIKFARGYTGRQHMISFINAYHGSTYGSLSLSAISANMRRKIGPLLPGCHHVTFPDSYRGLYGNPEPATVDEYLAPLREMLASYVPADEVACIVVETLQGDGGLLEAVPGYFRALRELCDEHGILLAVDDVQQGLGRTGTWCSLEHYDVVPDLVVYGKSLAAGLPLSALVGRAEIMDSLAAPAHLFTTGANPVCCAAALATLQYIEDNDLLAESRRKGELAKERMQGWVERFDCVGDVRGLGLSLGVDIVSDKVAKTKDPEAALKICNRCFERGLVMIAFAGSVLRFQPPLVITDEELTTVLDTIEGVLEEWEAGELADYEVSGQGW